MYFNELTMEDLENQYGTKEQKKSIFMSYVEDVTSNKSTKENKPFDDEASPFNLADFVEKETIDEVVEEIEPFEDEASPFDPADFI